MRFEKIRNALRQFAHKPTATALILLLVAISAYGLYLPWMGFYWDDWPWIWRLHTYGPQAIREIDASFRPLAGIVLWIGTQLAGENALGWQLYNFVIRWLGAVALWWALRQIWPKRHQTLTWAAVLFLVYPGFGQQFVSINSSRHLFPLVSFFLSLGFTGKAILGQRNRWGLTAVAVALSLITLFTTEYYYGLELIRVLILVILCGRKEQVPRKKLGDILNAWLPYALPLAIVFAWRFATSQSINYQVVLVDRFQISPLQTLAGIMATAGGDLIEVTLGAWGRLFQFPSAALFGPRKTLLYWGILGMSALGIFIFTSLLKPDAADRGWNAQALVTGGAAVLISGLPFWATDLEVKLAFPNDRLTLPMMMGVSLLTVALIDLIKPVLFKNLALALVVGLSVGVHFQNAVSYQRDWETQAAFFQQFTWRVPGLAPGTAVLTPELPIHYATDNSLTAPLNWIYPTQEPPPTLPYGLFYIDLRLGTKISTLKAGAPIRMGYGPIQFEGSTSQALLVYYNPPACLRVLHPQYDENLPGTPDLLEEAIPFSNLDRILVEVDSPAALPENIYTDSSSAENQWCYYFQKADLARQMEDWERIATLGEIAFKLEDSPNHASERVPFIEGYAHVGDWDTALDLTLETIKINKFMGAMLCDTLEQIHLNTPKSQDRDAAIQTIEERLACGFAP